MLSSEDKIFACRNVKKTDKKISQQELGNMKSDTFYECCEELVRSNALHEAVSHSCLELWIALLQSQHLFL